MIRCDVVVSAICGRTFSTKVGLSALAELAFTAFYDV